MLAKAHEFPGEAEAAGIVPGAKMPIILISRPDFAKAGPGPPPSLFSSPGSPRGGVSIAQDIVTGGHDHV